MTFEPSYLSRLRRSANGAIVNNLIALGPEPRPASAEGDGTFRLALRPVQKGFVKAGMKATGADKRFDRTVRGLAGPGFSGPEFEQLKERVLDKIEMDEVGTLTGIVERPPVSLQRNQKAVIDSLMQRLGSDSLAEKARAAYGRTVGSQQIKVR